MAATHNRLAKLALALTLGMVSWVPAGCGGKVSTNTNFGAAPLEACDKTAQCGSGLACRCGICTVECTSDADCEFEGVEGVCATNESCQVVALCAKRLVAQRPPTEEALDAGSSLYGFGGLGVFGTGLQPPAPAEAVSTGCGNGHFEPETEECDPSASDDPTPHGSCNVDCTQSVCGDGWLGQDEVCDTELTSTCADDCSQLEGCGNGIIDDGEQCDPGSETEDSEACAPNCTMRGCGNGYTDQVGEFNEVCDDGNNVSEDGCSADCLSDETCGNGIVDSSKGEVCDDGNGTSGDGCSSTCRSRGACGDGYVDWISEEVCDDGNEIGGDGCSADCLSNEVCGNGSLDLATGEECDTRGEDTYFCNGLTVGPLACKFGRCGDGYVNLAAGEECEPNVSENPLCLGLAAGVVACKISVCGDGHCNTASEYGEAAAADAGPRDFCPVDCD